MRAVLGAFVAFLVVAVPAWAKGPDSARLCGASGCASTQKLEDVNVLALWTSGFDARAEPDPAPFFTVDLSSSRGTKQEWSFLYVPSARAVKVVQADFSGGVSGVTTMNAWVSPRDDVLAVYDRLTGEISPYAASDGWIPAEDAGRELPWVPGALVAAVLAVGLLLSRRLTRRSAHPLTKERLAAVRRAR